MSFFAGDGGSVVSFPDGRALDAFLNQPNARAFRALSSNEELYGYPQYARAFRDTGVLFDRAEEPCALNAAGDVVPASLIQAASGGEVRAWPAATLQLRFDAYCAQYLREQGAPFVYAGATLTGGEAR